MDYAGGDKKSANLHIQDGRHVTYVIKPHRYCIGYKTLIVEGGDFNIRYANVRCNYNNFRIR